MPVEAILHATHTVHSNITWSKWCAHMLFSCRVCGNEHGILMMNIGLPSDSYGTRLYPAKLLRKRVPSSEQLLSSRLLLVSFLICYLVSGETLHSLLVEYCRARVSSTKNGSRLWSTPTRRCTGEHVPGKKWSVQSPRANPLRGSL